MLSMSFLFVAVSFFLQQVQCFLILSPFSRLSANRRPIYSSTWKVTSMLHLRKNTTETDDFVFNVADLFGVAVAAQLVGLQDVLGETSFWQGGGWFQPVTFESGSSVLSELLQRFSMMSSVFLGASWIVGSPKALTDNTSILQFAIKSAVTYGMIRLLVEVGTAALSNEEVLLTHTLRETYMIALANATTRYVLNNYFYR